jgi:hypothetical protein
MTIQDAILQSQVRSKFFRYYVTVAPGMNRYFTEAEYNQAKAYAEANATQVKKLD